MEHPRKSQTAKKGSVGLSALIVGAPAPPGLFEKVKND